MGEPTRDSYDRVAGQYADHLLDELDRKPLDRALLAAFAETAPAGPVADLGCGPGQSARHLHLLGRQVIGIDVSPGMVETARRASPGPEYRVGTMLDLDLAGGSLGGAVALYSIVHLTPADLPAAFAELRRVLRPEGVALIAFHVGRHVVHIEDMWGVPVSLDFHFHAPDAVRGLLEAGGLDVEWDLRRQPSAGEVQTERCYLLARRSRLALRPATEADRELLRALHHACFRASVDPVWGWDEADQDRRFDEAFSTEGRSVVELAGEPVGTLRTSRDRGLVVDDVEVAPPHQGRGIGTRLLRRVLAEADRDGLPVRLRVLRASRARRLYERLGFAVEGSTDTHLLMVREAPERGRLEA
jgi:SAM-dependent methyltransferase